MNECGALDSHTSMLPLVILTYEDFDRAWHREHDSGLVHVICAGTRMY